jgi:hypothetical protein
MALFTRHSDKADTPAPADLREAEFETVRGFYADGLVRQIWLQEVIHTLAKDALDSIT